MIQMLLAASVPEHSVGMVSDDVVGLHGAPAMGDEVELLQADLVQHREQLRGDARVTVVAALLFRLAVALEVNRDAPVLAAQVGHLVVPLKPRVRDAVQEHHRLAFADLHVMPSDELVIAGRATKRWVKV